MTVRHGVTPCGKTLDLDGYDHVPSQITMRSKCDECSAVSDDNPSGLAVIHMVNFPHPDGEQSVAGELGPQP